jgi:iron(III) transport system permease protein
MTRLTRWLAHLALFIALIAVAGWPALATVIEGSKASLSPDRALAASGSALDAAGSIELLAESRGFSRPVLLARESIVLVLLTEALALPVGIVLAVFLFRTDAWGRWLLVLLFALAVFVPLPLHATAWLGAFGNAGRAQVIGVRPVLVGRIGAAIVHALASLPWVVLIQGVGLCAVEPELEETALLEMPPLSVLLRVSLRRTVSTIAAAALAVAVLTASDMTVTDLLQIRTYAEEAYIQYMLGRGPGEAAVVSLPPLLLLGFLIIIVGKWLARYDPGRVISSLPRARLWRLGRLRFAGGLLLWALVGNGVALPLYGLIWRAGRVGGRVSLGQPPTWSLTGFVGTLRFAAGEIARPLSASLMLSAIAATFAVAMAWSLAWSSRGSTTARVMTITVLILTLATPGSVAGMALVLAYRDLPIIYDSQAMVVLAQAGRSLPYAILLLWPLIRSFPQAYLDAAALDGYGPDDQVLHVALPLSWRPVVAAWAVAFAIGLGELPATNIAYPPGVEPMSVFIWGLLHTGVESHLAGVALIMLLVVAAAGLAAALAVWSLRRPGALGTEGALQGI